MKKIVAVLGLVCMLLSSNAFAWDDEDGYVVCAKSTRVAQCENGLGNRISMGFTSCETVYQKPNASPWGTCSASGWPHMVDGPFYSPADAQYSMRESCCHENGAWRNN